MRGQKLRPGCWKDDLGSTLVEMHLVKMSVKDPASPLPSAGSTHSTGPTGICVGEAVHRGSARKSSEVEQTGVPREGREAADERDGKQDTGEEGARLPSSNRERCYKIY